MICVSIRCKFASDGLDRLMACHKPSDTVGEPRRAVNFSLHTASLHSESLENPMQKRQPWSIEIGSPTVSGTLLDSVFVHTKVVMFQYPKRLIFRDPFRYPSVFKNQFLNGCQGKREREAFCTFKWKAKRMGNSEEAMTL